MYRNLLILFSLIVKCAVAQYAPAAGLPGSTAMHKDDESFAAWASACVVTRGWQNMADTTLGVATTGDETAATGKAGENGVVSLGDGGIATVTFNGYLFNGPGYDFAVFENGFPTGDSTLAFLEFAFVEVSSDGINFTRFPATSSIQDTMQMPMAGIDASLIHNLAGKYVALYGTPFDLDELKDTPGLDVNSITHVRLVDVVGSIDPVFASYDYNNRPINDPFPTPFPSGGFDLDAVGAIHFTYVSSASAMQRQKVMAYPNPCKAGNLLKVVSDNHVEERHLLITDLLGKTVFSSSASGVAFINTENMSTGVYVLHVHSGAKVFTQKIQIF